MMRDEWRKKTNPFRRRLSGRVYATLRVSESNHQAPDARNEAIDSAANIINTYSEKSYETDSASERHSPPRRGTDRTKMGAYGQPTNLFVHLRHENPPGPRGGLRAGRADATDRRQRRARHHAPYRGLQG